MGRRVRKSLRLVDQTLAVSRTHLRRLPLLARSPLVAAIDTAALQRIESEHDGYLVLDCWPEHLVLDALAHDASLLRGPDLPVSTAFTHLRIEWDGDTLIRRLGAPTKGRRSGGRP